MSDTSQRDSIACTYCGDGKHTGLPGNSCENCMNTGLAYQPVAACSALVTDAMKARAWKQLKKEYRGYVTKGMSDRILEAAMRDTIPIALPPKITGGE